MKILVDCTVVTPPRRLPKDDAGSIGNCDDDEIGDSYRPFRKLENVMYCCGFRRVDSEWHAILDVTSVL